MGRQVCWGCDGVEFLEVKVESITVLQVDGICCILFCGSSTIVGCGNSTYGDFNWIRVGGSIEDSSTQWLCLWDRVRVRGVRSRQILAQNVQFLYTHSHLRAP